MSRTVINVDEWAGWPSLFQPSLNRKFPLSLTMYSLHQSDRVEASYTPLPSPSPKPPPSVYSKEEGKPEETAKITLQTDKIYKTRTLRSHPSKPKGFDYLHAFCKNIDCKRNHSGDDGGGGSTICRVLDLRFFGSEDLMLDGICSCENSYSSDRHQKALRLIKNIGWSSCQHKGQHLQICLI